MPSRMSCSLRDHLGEPESLHHPVQHECARTDDVTRPGCMDPMAARSVRVWPSGCAVTARPTRPQMCAWWVRDSRQPAGRARWPSRSSPSLQPDQGARVLHWHCFFDGLERPVDLRGRGLNLRSRRRVGVQVPLGQAHASK